MNIQNGINYKSETKYKSLYNCKNNEQFQEKIAKLKIAKQILKSNEEEIQKALDIIILFSNYTGGFDLAYKSILENGENDPELQDCYDYITIISTKLKTWQENGLYKDAKAILNLINNMKKNDFELACQILEAYVNFKGIEDEEFYEEYQIIPINFDKYRKIVARFAPNSNLYKQFLKKQESNIQNQYYEAINNLIDIITAIETGFFKDGTKFSEIEFWARIPFRKRPIKQFNQIKQYLKNGATMKVPHFRKAIQTFASSLVDMNILTNEQYQTINNYLIKNNIGELFICSEVDIRHSTSGISQISTLADDGSIIPGSTYIIKEEDIKNIIEYIKLRKIPMCIKSFYIVMDAYKKNKITKETIENLKEKKKSKSIILS